MPEQVLSDTQLYNICMKYDTGQIYGREKRILETLILLFLYKGKLYIYEDNIAHRTVCTTYLILVFQYIITA